MNQEVERKENSSLNPIKIVKEHVDEEVEDVKGTTDISDKEPIKEKKSEESQDEEIIEIDLKKRKEQTLKFLKQKKEWIFYIILAFIVYIGISIRIRNIPRLRDITTGSWTLGPDLDPFLFLRWAKEILETGGLATIDLMRNVPLGFNTAGEAKLLSYLIVWFHKSASFFTGNPDITYSAIIFPVFMFGLTTIAFFLFARKVFYKEEKNIRNIIALVATSFFILVPSLLPRTIAGIPEKESAAFFFIFISFYLFIEAFTTKKIKKSFIFGVLAGISTGLLGLIWGGVTFVFMTVAGAVLFSFILGKIERKELYVFGIWIISFVAISSPFSTRYSPINLITSTSTGLIFATFFIIIIDLILFKEDKLKIKAKLIKKTGNKIPEKILSLIISLIILFILVTTFLGPGFIIVKSKDLIEKTIHPLDVSRFGLTVAENRQPFFINDWKNSFGPIFSNIPLFFWLFFIGSIYLFNNMISNLRKKEKIILTFSYFIFLTSLIFSKYSPSSSLNGDTGLSLIVYSGGLLFFVGSFGYFYYKRYKNEELSIFKEFNFSYIVYFIVLTMAIIGARGAIRLIMVLGAVSPVAIGFLVVKTSQSYFKEKDETTKIIIGIIALIIIISSIFTLWTYYNVDKATGENFAPGSYNQQWQRAMAWVRENTSKDAVFAHWWDYGYWLQSIGERATILDGGNAITYWNHLMGRHVLTGTDERLALEFLYTHDGTHLLIDSTEIGKYTAYSSIGSDENYDRFSWINTFLMGERQTRETSNETFYFYGGGTSVDEDIVWNQEGVEILLPRRSSGVGGLIVRTDTEENILQPIAIFVYNGRQLNIPLRFIYYKGELHDFGSGLDAGIFIFPSAAPQGNNINFNERGAVMYLSPRTIHSGLARYYLFDQDSDYFNLVHIENNFLVENLKNQLGDFGNFIHFNGFQGPIKIWEINYPEDIESNPEFLSTIYPEEIKIAKTGEYN